MHDMLYRYQENVFQYHPMQQHQEVHHRLHEATHLHQNVQAVRLSDGICTPPKINFRPLTRR